MDDIKVAGAEASAQDATVAVEYPSSVLESMLDEARTREAANERVNAREGLVRKVEKYRAHLAGAEEALAEFDAEEQGA